MKQELTLTIDADGSISKIAGGPLEEPVLTGMLRRKVDVPEPRGAVTFSELPDEDPPDNPIPIDPPDDHVYVADPEHTDFAWCWCQPKVIHRPNGGEVIVHRRHSDGPE